ncbi:hypothetical protein NEMBOFW57_002714 [Staphylotrichum longicolle]|uniref:BTB domain-containing protein n=1 Tax=Staphylotrichum longicolle TaxID=669026 RepID=A0AAD4F3V4_9PEZI|nr:hypothetical protein NEMBOFW57_002714 [Staphylotrichum longicolle]
MAENKRLKMTEERENRTRALIAAHDHGSISLWESQYEWDVMVTCGSHVWRLHRDILCRESELFRARLPPKDPNGGYVTFDCSNHCPTQLANALYFMYHKTLPTGTLTLVNPLDGSPIRHAVFAFIAGASVACSAMTAAALAALDTAASRLRTFFLSQRDPATALAAADLAPLYDPLSDALIMAYGQGGGARACVRPLRVALAHLLDVTVLWLALNPGFREMMGARWTAWVFPHVVRDCAQFGREGVLDEMFGRLEERAGRGALPAKGGRRRRWGVEMEMENGEETREGSREKGEEGGLGELGSSLLNCLKE